MKTLYCPVCRADQSFRTEDREETYTVKGEQVTVPVTVDVCPVCSETRFDEERDSDMLKRVYNIYRARHNLLTSEEIQAIRNRYNLSQKALAALLGMSEATINRYEVGAVQEETHDNLLRMAAEPANMRSLLDRRGHLLTESQRQAVQQALAAMPGWQSAVILR